MADSQISVKKLLDNSLPTSDYRATMSKELNLASKIKALKIGKCFFVETERERVSVLKMAKTLKAAGVIEFDVVTKQDDKGFKVAAI